MESEFPSNSKANKPSSNRAKDETTKVEKVVTGTVVTRKKPLGRRFKETFVGGDAKGVGEYVVVDVLVPAAKDMIVDGFTQFIERMFYQESRSTLRYGSSRYRSGGHTPYNRMSDPRRREEPRRERRNRALHNFDEFILETRAEASEVLDRLHARIDKYGAATVADLYDMLGETGNYTDVKYGWVDLQGSGISRVDGGYLLDLPRPEPLD